MANRNVTTRQGQTIFDIVSQEYGNANSLHDFLELNVGLGLNSNLTAGTVVIVDTEDAGDQKVKDFYNRKTTGDKKVNIPANYVEYKANDYSEDDYDSDDYS